MHTVLAVLGWVLLALLAVLVLLLVAPVRLAIELKYDKLTATLKVLFLSFRLYPFREKKEPEAEKPAEQPTPEPAAPQKEPEKPKNTAKQQKSVTLSDVVELVRTANWLMKIVFRVIRFTDIKLLLPIHKEDAAETAIAYGQTQAYLGTALGALQNWLNLKFSKLELIPDFTGAHKYRRYFYCKIVATPFIMVIAALYAFTHLKVERIL